MGRRLYSRKPDGRFRRATLENTLGLSAPACPSCGRLNPHAVNEPPPENCHACDAPMRPVARCGPCGARITLLGGSWTTGDGTTACTDSLAAYVPHQPAADPDTPGEESDDPVTGWADGMACRVAEHDDETREPKPGGRSFPARVTLVTSLYVFVVYDDPAPWKPGKPDQFWASSGWRAWDGELRWRLLPDDQEAAVRPEGGADDDG